MCITHSHTLFIQLELQGREYLGRMSHVMSLAYSTHLCVTVNSAKVTLGGKSPDPGTGSRAMISSPHLHSKPACFLMGLRHPDLGAAIAALHVQPSSSPLLALLLHH